MIANNGSLLAYHGSALTPFRAGLTTAYRSGGLLKPSGETMPDYRTGRMIPSQGSGLILNPGQSSVQHGSLNVTG